MKVIPIKKFGKYQPGEEFEFPDRAAKVFIKLGKLQAAKPKAPVYQTRMMQAAAPVAAEPARIRVVADANEEAPYGYKADGTPRRRPGRAPSVS